MATTINPLDRINQLVEKVKKLREERDAKVKALDEGVEAAEAELQDAVAAMRGALDAAVAPVVKKRGGGSGRFGRGELMVKVNEMLAKNMDAAAIAAELDCSLDNINQTIRRIRKKTIEERAARPPAIALPPPAAPPRPTGDRAVVGSPPPAPARINGFHDDEESAATVDDLRKVVLRGSGTKARLMSTARSGHKHIVEVNRDGNGYTATGGKDGHAHAVKAFVMGPGPDGHRHDLTTEAA